MSRTFLKRSRAVAFFFFCVVAAVTSFGQVAAGASNSRVRAVRPPVLHTNDQLIEKAEAAGRIDHETALVYKVFALMGDCRLPKEFIGNAPTPPDSDTLDDVRSQFDTFSAATQQTLRPFLMRPDEPGSWTELDSNCANQTLRNSSAVGTTALQWVTVQTSNGKATIHSIRGSRGDAILASNLAAELDRVWDRLTAVFGEREPRPDDDSRYKLYLALTSSVREPTTPIGLIDGPRCSDTGSHVLLNESLPIDDLKHELVFLLTKAIIRTYDIGNCRDYRWLATATAMWAVQYIYPESFPRYRASQFAEDPAAVFLETPELPLETGGGRQYGAYLFLYFLEHQLRDLSLVRGFWENASQPDSLVDIDSVLASRGGFSNVWPQFVRYNWNQKPVDDYQRSDRSLTFHPTDDTELTTTSDGMSVEIAASARPLRQLSARYYHFNIGRVSSVLVLNGWTFEADKNVVQNAVLSPLAFTSVPLQSGGETIHVEALGKINGQWEKYIGSSAWTDKKFISFCIDEPSEQLEELVVIVSNSEFRSRSSDFTPPKLALVFFGSNAGCKWHGTAKSTVSESQLPPGASAVLIQESDNVTWQRTETAITVPYRNGVAVLGWFFRPSDDVRVSWRVETAGCSATPNTGSFAPTGAALNLWAFVPQGSSLYRAYLAGDTSDALGKSFTLTCPTPYGPEGGEEPFPLWLATFTKGEILPKLTQDGRTMCCNDGENPVEFEWKFTADQHP